MSRDGHKSEQVELLLQDIIWTGKALTFLGRVKEYLLRDAGHRRGLQSRAVLKQKEALGQEARKNLQRRGPEAWAAYTFLETSLLPADSQSSSDPCLASLVVTASPKPSCEPF